MSSKIAEDKKIILRRKIYDRLLSWKKESNGKSAVLIDGARRTGKSFIAREFAEKEYASHIIVDFGKEDPDVKFMVDYGPSDLDLFFARLSAHFSTRLYERNSLIVFDEVQQYPKARQMIKYLVEDGRYDYLETGSLLSLRKNVQDIIIPSEEEHIELFPMDFEEFLWAMGDDVTMDYIRSSYERKTPMGAVHRKVMDDFRKYILVGGMPQAVLAYMDGNDFEKADKAKRGILRLYREDIAKFAPGYEDKVYAVFDGIPGQLSKKEKKYNISSLGRNARFRSYEESFIWLGEAMITNIAFNATDPSMGLGLSLDDTKQKCYMADTGLLVTHAFMDVPFVDNELYKAILFDKLHVNEGMIAENIVAQMLRTSGHRLYFYSRHDSIDRSNEMEIDFLISQNRKICPVEVKAGESTKHESLNKFTLRFSKKLGTRYILHTKDLKESDGILYLPLYMACLL